MLTHESRQLPSWLIFDVRQYLNEFGVFTVYLTMKVLLAVIAFSIAGFGPLAAQRPSESGLRVTLVSDGHTWVSISDVMVPAQFKTKTITLKPGEYEAIGRRKGYWDVRQRIVVLSGTSLPVVHVVCTLTTDYWPDGSPKK